jgi:ATP-binding cassette, subfamily C (CFTR/MRP), member 1
LSGLCTIRAFGWVNESLELNRQLLDSSQNPNYLLYMIQRWLTFVLDIIVAIVAVIVVALAVKLRGSSGFAGVALTQVMFLNLTLREIILTWTDVETSIGSVSRVKIFGENTESEHLHGEVNQPPEDWPLNGRIEFRSIVASYE